jgi:hypothetical protein
VLCNRLLILGRSHLPTSDPAVVICDVCRALPKPQQRRLRNDAMIRMLRESLPGH